MTWLFWFTVASLEYSTYKKTIKHIFLMQESLLSQLSWKVIQPLLKPHNLSKTALDIFGKSWLLEYFSSKLLNFTSAAFYVFVSVCTFSL